MVQQPLRARVDINTFDPRVLVEFGNNTPSVIDFHPDNIRSNIDAKPGLDNIDGWGWWSFDIGPEQTGDYHWLPDDGYQTGIKAGVFLHGWNPEYNEYDSAGAEAYYYNGESPALSGQ